MAQTLEAKPTLVQVINGFADQIEQGRQIKARLETIVRQITGIEDSATNPLPPSPLPSDYVVTDRLMWQAGTLSATHSDINRLLNMLEAGIGDLPQPGLSAGSAAVTPIRR